MKLTTLGIFILLFVVASCSSSKADHYNKKLAKSQGLTDCYESYETAYAVSFGNDYEDQYFSRAFESGQWISSLEKKIELDEDQIRAVQSIISNHSIRSNSSNKCEFLPHHSIVFFDTNNDYLGEISVCFMCDQYLTPSMSYDDDMNSKSSDKLKALFKVLGFEIQ